MYDYYAPDFEVKIEGLTMEADVTHAIIDLTYESSLDTADMVTMRLNNADLRFTDSALFDVGKNIELYMGYVGNLQPMMLGEITAVSPEFPESGAPTLTVTGYDKSYRMRQNNRERSFLLGNPSLIATQIAAENLLIPVVAPSPLMLDQFTQVGSDMQTLQELADRTFFDVYVEWNNLHFHPRVETEAVCLEWGKNLSSFSPRLSTANQAGAIAVCGYDNKLAQAIVGLVPLVAVDFNVEVMVERLGRAMVDQLVNQGVKNVTGEPIYSYVDAAAYAKTLLMALLEGLFEGHGTCIGIPELHAGVMVEISGVGRRFSGKYRVSKATHTIGEGGYRTSFEITQRNSGSVLQIMRRFLGAGGKARKPGSMVATVLNNVDPTNMGQVLVTYPGLGGAVTNWAKVSPSSSGEYFMPNIGDDVEVIFENGDIDHPKIIGRSWNVRQMPPEPPTPTNFRRLIRSPQGHTIIFDDTPGSGGVHISTLSGAEVAIGGLGEVEMMSSGGAQIILDQLGNVEIKAGPQGSVSITSAPTGQIRLNCPPSA